MPNGGQHFYTIAHCPNCNSMRLHMRQGQHLFDRWRCRKCRKKFFAPDWIELIYPRNSSGPPRWAIDDDWNKYENITGKPYLNNLKKQGMVK